MMGNVTGFYHASLFAFISGYSLLVLIILRDYRKPLILKLINNRKKNLEYSFGYHWLETLSNPGVSIYVPKILLFYV